MVPLHPQVVRRRLLRRLDRARAGGCTTSRSRTDTREDILKAADIFLENGIYIESGPHKHAIQQTFFLYVYEPGGNRIEFCNAGRPAAAGPGLAAVTWTEAERAKGQAWGMKTIETFHTHGTPPVDQAQAEYLFRDALEERLLR